jgi:hypothetical protein
MTKDNDQAAPRLQWKERVCKKTFWVEGIQVVRREEAIHNQAKCEAEESASWSDAVG